MLTSASVSSEPVVAIPSPSIPSVLWGTVSRLRNAILRPFTLPFIFFIMAYKFFWVWLEKRRRGTLHGKVVLVTGASSGLGKSIARKFYHLGSRVILSARNKAELEEFRAELLAGQQGSTTFPPVVLPMDLQDVNSIEALVQNVLRLNSGRVDILINCGGIGYRGTIADTALDVDIRLMLVNYFGHVALTRALLPSMRSARSGHIVFIGSVQGKMAIPQRSSYSASKHALGAFCDCLRAEVAADGIQVSLVAPSYIKTNFSRNAVTGEGDRHGEMDPTTASGMNPDSVADKVIRAIVLQESEVIVAPLWIRVAILIRALLPNVFFTFMKYRARRMEIKEITHGNRKENLKDD